MLYYAARLVAVRLPSKEFAAFLISRMTFPGAFLLIFALEMQQNLLNQLTAPPIYVNKI